MATRFKRFCAYFPGRPCALSACGHSHFACVAVKIAIILFFGCAGLALTLADARGNSFVAVRLQRLFGDSRSKQRVRRAVR